MYSGPKAVYLINDLARGSGMTPIYSVSPQFIGYDSEELEIISLFYSMLSHDRFVEYMSRAWRAESSFYHYGDCWYATGSLLDKPSDIEEGGPKLHEVLFGARHDQILVPKRDFYFISYRIAAEYLLLDSVVGQGSLFSEQDRVVITNSMRQLLLTLNGSEPGFINL